jgi:predicted ATPase
MYLTGISRKPTGTPDGFPFTLPVVAALAELDLTAPVTFLVGENGSGKSTLLEGLAAGSGAVAMGSRDLARDETLRAARAFAGAYRFARKRQPKAKLFLRAEDVFGFTQRVAGDMASLREIEADLDRDLPDSYGKRLAMGAVRGQRGALAGRYGDDPDARSHGETFLALLSARLAPKGLYFLDEPEAPLSPLRVLALMALLKERVAQDCQFVVATHSPILMAFPGADLRLVEGDRIRHVAYEDIEHVRITRAFLNDPERYLRHL